MGLAAWAYDYKIEYKAANQLQHADGLSRLPLADVPVNVPIPGAIREYRVSVPQCVENPTAYRL